jgi:putative polyketide hydroxylase
VLRDHLRTFPSARLEVGAEVVSVSNRSEGARVVLSSGRRIDARYLVAADGAHSGVRTALGVPMAGTDPFVHGIRLQFRAPLWDVVGEHRYGIYAVMRPDASCVVLPAGGGDRWMVGIDWDPAAEHLADYTEARLTSFLARAAGVPALAPRIEQVGTFAFAARMAERFRCGDVFLVGDAAHRITPRGGTGMNTAVADAFDLGWRLSWVLRGWAAPSLLDAYETERRPLVEHNLSRSAAADGSRRPAINETQVDLGGRIAHHWLATDTGRVSTLDLIGSGLTLFTGADRGAWSRAAASQPDTMPMAVRPLEPVAARALGIVGSGALLVRPDGASVASWSTSAGAARRLHDVVAPLVAGRRARSAA